MSRGFFCALFGIAITVFSWSAPWAWPAWPAVTTSRIILGTRVAFVDLPYGERAAIFVLMIAVNVAFWAVAAWLVLRSAQWLMARRRPAVEP